MKISKFLPFLLAAVVIVCYYSFIWNNSVNVPLGDDFYCLLFFTQEFQDAASLGDRFRLLFQQWVEHRIVFSRLSALLSYVLHDGYVNFITIILIGNSFLLGFVILFWKFIKQLALPASYLLPIVLVLFNPVMFEGNLWAGASTVYMPVCFMGLLTVHLLTSRIRYGLYLALAVALLATFSFGNGMLSFPAGILTIIMMRNYRQLVVWIPVMILAIVAYFYNFSAANATNAFALADRFNEPAYLLYNFFGFVGGLADYTENNNLKLSNDNITGICFGILLTLLVIGGIWKTFREKWSNHIGYMLQVRWLGMVAFIGITAVLMAYSRTNEDNINTLSSRYKIFSMIVFILVYLEALIYLRGKTAVAWLLGLLSVLLLGSGYYFSYGKFIAFKSHNLAGEFNYSVNGKWAVYRRTDFFEQGTKFISDTIRKSKRPVFKFETVFPEVNLSAIQTAPVLSDVILGEYGFCNGRKGACTDLHSNTYPIVSNRFDGIYLVVYNESDIYLFPATPRKNGRRAMLMTGSYFKPGFTIVEHWDDFLPLGKGNYNLAVFCPTEKQKIMRINGGIGY